MKKGFITGLLSGLLMGVFFFCAVSCGKMLTSGQEAQEQPEGTPQSGVAQQQETQQPATSGNKNNNGYVLDDSSVERKLEDIEDIIKDLYIDDVTEDQLAEGLFDGIMESLGDPYSVYYTPEEFAELLSDTEGVYYGIGAYLQMDLLYGYPKITGIIANSPAEASTLRVDDYITMVDGVDIIGMELSEAVKLIKGPEGTDVTLTIIRQSDGTEFEEILTRQKVETPTVTYEMKEDGIGLISISQFDEVTVNQFAEALAAVKEEHAKALVLDLRGNPGGSLQAVVDIAGMLLPEGNVVYTVDKYGYRQDYPSQGNQELDIPMVVLVNGGSASAAEILAGAIKDYGKGTLLGTTTYGKGIVQRLVQLKDGSGIKLTVSHYYTPLGNDIHKVGIEPDEVLAFDGEAYYTADPADSVDNQLERAIEILKEEIK
ncbi:MAG: S41 family peptidase [Lachnospiraceae bacterium]|nr:S41 family peptidase [Lachnospiraceae bacterium]